MRQSNRHVDENERRVGAKGNEFGEGLCDAILQSGPGFVNGEPSRAASVDADKLAGPFPAGFRNSVIHKSFNIGEGASSHSCWRTIGMKIATSQVIDILGLADLC